jgi:hypothetical protein
MKLDLAALSKRLKQRSALAVTISSQNVGVTFLRQENGASRVVKSFTLPIGAEMIASDPAGAGAALAEQLAAQGIKERRCVICVPAGWALTAASDVPELNAEDLRGYLELKAEREFTVPLTELRLAHSLYTLPDGTRRATVAALPAKRLDVVEKMLDAAGCRAVSISLGLDRCVPPGKQAAAPALHFLANGNHVDVVVSAGSGIAAVRTLPGAATAEAFDSANFFREMRITLGRLPEPLRAQVREARFGGAQLGAERLSQIVREPLQRIGIHETSVQPASNVEGAALDAAERHLSEQPVLFEFVAPTTKRWDAWLQRFDSKRRRLLVGAAVGLIVLPAVAFFIRSRIENHLSREWNQMRGSVADLEAVQQKIRQFRPWFEPAPQTLQLLEGLMSAFPDQGDVWAKSVQTAEAGKVTCTGFARNQPAMMAFLDKLRARPDVAGLQVQQVRGENPVQFTVVYKWEPKNAQ